MDMDSSSHHNTNNWLAFSLSNNSLLFPSNGVLDQEDGSTAVLGVGPKLEDFLGGAGGETAGGFGGGAQVINGLPQVDIYGDSELRTIAASFLGGFSTEQNKQLAVVPAPAAPPPPLPVKKAVDTFGQRTSIFRGVTRHRWTGRYEAHLWDNSCRREGQSRKGRQVYLGGYDKEEKAARAYDLAALKYWGPTTTTNFPVSDYEKEMDDMKHMNRQEFVASLRRRSSGFSRGASMYRGVTRHHQHGRWQARIGRVAGNKDLYLGTFSTQEEAAEAYDIAAIKFRGLNAVTNFDMSRYDVRSIASSNLPVGGAVNNKSKTSSESDKKSSSEVVDYNNSNNDLASSTSGTINFCLPSKQDQSSSNLWAALGYQAPAMWGRNPTFPDSNGTAPFRTDFQCYNQHHHQQSSEGTTAPSCSTSTAVVSNDDGGSGWIVQAAGASTAAAHSFQGGGKVRSLSAFQTPIFGME